MLKFILIAIVEHEARSIFLDLDLTSIMFQLSEECLWILELFERFNLGKENFVYNLRVFLKVEGVVSCDFERGILMDGKSDLVVMPLDLELFIRNMLFHGKNYSKKKN